MADRKRKLLASQSDAEPPVKREKLEAAASAGPPQRKLDPMLLQHQNKAMATKLGELKTEIAELQGKLSRQEAKQSYYDNTLSAVHRHWERMEQDLSLVLGQVSDSAAGSASSAGEAAAGAGAEAKDLLQRLLALRVPLTIVDVDDTSELEEALSKRVAFTTKVLTDTVSSLLSTRQLCEDVTRRIEAADGVDEAVKKELASLRDTIARVQTSVDRLHEDNRRIEIQAAHCKDALTVSLQKQRDAENELEEVKMSLVQTQRNLGRSKERIATLQDQLAAAQRNSGDVGDGTVGSSSSNITAAAAVSSAAAGSVTGGAVGASEDAAAAQRAVQELQAELADTRRLLDARQDELEQTSQTVSHLQGQLEDERVKASVEGAGGGAGSGGSGRCTRCRELDWALNQVSEMNRELLAELDLTRTTAVAKEQESAGHIGSLTAKLKRAEDAQAALVVSRDQARGALAAREALLQNTRRLKEAEKLVSTMQQQIRKLRDTGGANQELRTMKEQMKSLQERYDDAKSQLADRQAAVDALAEQQALWTEKEAKLMALIKSYHDGKVDADALAKDANRIRADDLERRCKTLMSESRAARDAQAAAQRRVLDLTAKEEAQRDGSGGLMAEIDSIGTAFEEMCEQNARLLQELRDKDDANTKLMAERLKASQVQSVLESEKGALEEKVRAVMAREQAARDESSLGSERIRALQELMNKANEQKDQLTSQIASMKSEEGTRTTQVETLQAQLTEARRLLAEQRPMLHDLRASLDKARRQTARADGERQLLRQKVDRMKMNGLQGDSGLELELQDVKQKVKCSVCLDNEKNTVLTTCFHAFCRGCISRNLQVRSRKCPRCSKRFDASDVHDLWL